MGGGSWSAASYDASTAFKTTRGISAFHYSDTTRSMSYDKWKVHENLDPKGVAFRESRDSAEHPTSVPISVLFDVTGSMRDVPKRLQQKLPELLGLLLRKGYVEHPQILFGAVGDATCDRVPLQVGQFESDNRMDENLEKIFLEGGGGGQNTESYELAMYWMARHTVTDAWEKRGKKGYLFLIGDELAYPKVKAREVREHIDDGLESDIDLKAIVRELQEKWEVFFILPQGSGYWGSSTLPEFWRDLFGQNFIFLEDPEGVCESIALTIGLAEGTVDLDAGLDDLKDSGASAGVIKSVGKALATVGAGAGTVATTDLPSSDDDSGIDRL